MLTTWQGHSLRLHKFGIWYFVYFTGFGCFPDWEIPQSKEHPKATKPNRTIKAQIWCFIKQPQIQNNKTKG